MLLNLAAISAVAISFFRHQSGSQFWQGVPSHDAMDPHGIRGILLALLCVVFILILLRHLTFAKGAAVLIVGDALLYPNFNRSPLIRRALLQEIGSFSIAPRRAFHPPAVAIHFKNGDVDYIPTIFLTEPPEAILPRLSVAFAVQKANRKTSG